MNYIDLIIGIALAWSAYRGFRKGFILGIVSLVALFLGLWGGFRFSGVVSDYLVNDLGWSSAFMPVISFGLTLVIIILLVYLTGKIVERLVEAVALGIINRIAGAVLSMAKMLLIISAIIFIINRVGAQNAFPGQENKQNSMLYEPVASIVPAIIPVLQKYKSHIGNEKQQEQDSVYIGNDETPM